MEKKVNNLNLTEKYTVIQMINQEKKNVKEVMEYFKCGKSQIYNILKNSKKICEKYLSGNENDLIAKKQRESENSRLNTIVYEWYCAARSKNCPVSGPLLQETALKTALLLQNKNFKASTGWLRSFRNRYNISFKSSGETSQTKPNVIEEWKKKLIDITRGYELKNIASGDETALFFKTLPDKTLHMKDERCSGGKHPRERITLFLIAYADGTIEEPAVIGKSQNPSCFKKLDKEKLPVSYFANSKAWMTSTIFEEVLMKVNHKMEKENRHILLFLDNKVCHPDLQLSNIKLFFLPPYSTTVLQPLCNGVIQSIKMDYRKLMLKELLLEKEKSEKASVLCKEVNLLDAIMFLCEAVRCVHPETVKQSFKYCGFQLLNLELNETNVNENVVEVQSMIEAIYESDKFSASDFIKVDRDAVTDMDEVDMNDFVETIVDSTYDNASAEIGNSDNDDEGDIIPTKFDALRSLEILEKFSKSEGENDFFTKVKEAKFYFMKNIFFDKKPIKIKVEVEMDDFHNPSPI